MEICKRLSLAAEVKSDFNFGGFEDGDRKKQTLIARVRLKNAFCKTCITICGRFCLNEGGVAGYGN
nr:DUF6783 domain-containing protein [Anaerobutyricum hallii]